MKIIPLKFIATSILVILSVISFSQTVDIWEVESQCTQLPGSGNILDANNPIPLVIYDGFAGQYSHNISNNIMQIDFTNTSAPNNWDAIDFNSIEWVGGTGNYFVKDGLGNPQAHDIATGFVYDMSDSINKYVSFDVQVDQQIELWVYLKDIVGRISNGDVPEITIPATVGGVNIYDESKWQHIVLAWNGDYTADGTTSIIEDSWSNMWNGVSLNRTLPAFDTLDIENIRGVLFNLDPGSYGQIGNNKTMYIRNLSIGGIGLNYTNFSYLTPVNFNYDNDSVSIDLMDYYTGTTASNFMAGVSSGNNILVSVDGSVVTVKAKNKCTAFNNSVQVQLTDADGLYTRTFPVIFSLENMEDPEIGVVSVDSLGSNILIAWERPNSTTIDTYSIYREGLTDQYTKIGDISYDSVSVFVDNSALVNTRAYKYKISYTNKCGVQSNFSSPHKSIHLQKTVTSSELILNWTQYEGASVLGYRILGGNQPRTMVSLDEFADDQTSYTISDPTYSIYRIQTIMADTIRPTVLKSESGPFTLALSNLAEAETSLSDIENDITVYPTVATDVVFVKSTSNKNMKLYLISESGEQVYKTKFSNNIQIPVSQYAKGMYVLKVAIGNEIIQKQIVIQ